MFRARVLARTLLYVFLVTSTFFRWFFRITYRTTLNVFVYCTRRTEVHVHVHVHYCTCTFDESTKINTEIISTTFMCTCTRTRSCTVHVLYT